MDQLNEKHSVWRTSTALIFWGTLALTVFGGVAYIFESIVGTLNIFVSFMKSYAGLSQESDGPNAFIKVYDRLSVAMRIFEMLLIAGWVAYVVGLSKFKTAQISQRGLNLTGNLYTACWLGLSSMFCYFVAGFLGWFGILFSLAGWVLLLVSLFKFHSSFRKLETENSWNGRARRGASSLRRSYTFAIILLFYPLASALIVLLMAVGMMGDIGSIVNSVSADGPAALLNYAAGMVVVLVLLGLAGFVMWILKFVYLLIGWLNVKSGSLAAVPMAQTEVIADANGITVEEEGLTYALNDEDDDSDDGSGNTWTVIGAIAGSIALILLILWLCFGGRGNSSRSDDATETALETEYVEEVTSDRSGERLSEDAETPRMSVEEEPASVSENYYDIYTGSINDRYGIVMTLTSDGGDNYGGEYYYTKNSKKTPIELRGNLLGDGTTLEMREYVDGKYTGTFRGTLEGGRYYGTWSSSGGEREYPFSVSL